MYVLARHFAIPSRSGAVIRVAAAAGACALLAGCAVNPFQNAQVDPNSPVAGEVARLANAGGPYPTFASIPPAPKDVRPPRSYGRQAQAIEQARDQLEQATAPGTWSLEGTDAFAAKARAAAGAEPPPGPSGAADAFADTQRKRATPPPPPPK
jgi:hypothetical protein